MSYNPWGPKEVEKTKQISTAQHHSIYYTQHHSIYYTFYLFDYVPLSVLAWRIPGMGEPGGLPSLGSHRVGHD